MSEIEGRDSVFGNALENIMESVEQQDVEEAKKTDEALKKKNSKAEDPLKAKNPKELSKEGEKDMKLHQIDAMGADVKPHPKEGKVPEEPKDDEKTKIEKLTEESEVASDVEALVQKAKDSLDSGEYDKVQDYTARLGQIKMAAAEVKDEPEETPASQVVEPELSEEPVESKIKEKISDWYRKEYPSWKYDDFEIGENVVLIADYGPSGIIYFHDKVTDRTVGITAYSRGEVVDRLDGKYVVRFPGQRGKDREVTVDSENLVLESDFDTKLDSFKES